MKLREIMTSLLDTIEPHAPVHEAAIKMKQADVAMLPVVSQGAILGIVTDHDLVVYALFEGRLGKAVRDVMSWHPLCLPEDREIAEAIELVQSSEAVGVVVTDGDGRPVGVLSYVDLALVAVGADTAGMEWRRRRALA